MNIQNLPVKKQKIFKKKKLLAVKKQAIKVQQAQLLQKDTAAYIYNDKEKIEHYVNASNIALSLSIMAMLVPAFKLLTLISLSYSAIPIFKLAEKSLLKEKKIRNDGLNALIVIGCVVTGKLFVGCVDVWLFNLGSKLVVQTQDRSKKLLTNLFDKAPDMVWVVKEQAEIQKNTKALSIEDIVVVKAGEVIPVDGTVIEGMAMVDQQVLTGESYPVEKQINDNVFASTLLIKGQIYLKIVQAGENTIAAKLNYIIHNTADFKTGLQLKGEKWANTMAPPLLNISALAFPFIGVSSALALMNSGTGNILRILAGFQTLDKLILAAKQGVLIKDGRVLEQLAQIDTIVFDKTGTLTDGQPVVKNIASFHKHYNKRQILAYAAMAEHKISHPIAQAIVNYAKKHNINFPKPEDSEYNIGYGVTVNFKNKIVQVGSLRFMQAENISIPKQVQETALIAVAIDKELIGTIDIQPQIRPEAGKIIKMLKTLSIQHICILSGDHIKPTQKLAEYLDISEYYAGVLPEQKAALIEDLQKKGRKVCFIGDGINDSIALKKANVSISINGATTAATDVAQVILMDGSLSKLYYLFKLGYDLEKNLQKSLLLSTGGGIANLTAALFFGLGILGSNILLGSVFITAMLSANKSMDKK